MMIKHGPAHPHSTWAGDYLQGDRQFGYRTDG